MRKLRRCLSIVLCAAVVFAGVSMTGSLQEVSAEETADDTSLTYEYEGHTFSYEAEDDTVTITGCTDADAASCVTEIVFPAEIDGMTVTGIGASAFKDYTALTSVTLPEGLTTMGSSAFYGCSVLKTVDLPDGLTAIPYAAFRGCSELVTVDFPENLKSIGMYAFYACQRLQKVCFPDALTVVYEFAFYGCTNVTYILLPANEVSIRDNNFDQSTDLTTVEYAEGCTRPYSDESWRNGNSFLGYAKTVIFPSTLNSMTTGSWTFGGAVNTDFFSAFSNVEEFIIAEDNPYFTTYDSCIYDIDLEVLYCVPRAADDIEFSPTCTEISNGAFAGCKNITELVIPDTVTKICGIEEVSGQHFQYGAIISCDSLETLVIPSSVTEIGSEAISGCASLTYVSLYYDGIHYCFSGENSEYVKELTDLTIADGTVEAAELTTDVFGVFDIQQIDSSDDEMTDLETRIESVHIPASTVSISTDYFDSMTALTAIEADAANTTYYTENGILYRYAEDGSGLTLVRYPIALGNAAFADGLTTLGTRAFYGCTARKTYEFPDTLTTVEAQAFYKCSFLNITFADGLTSIGDEAFYYSMNSSVYLPESVNSIGTDAFYTIDASITVTCAAGSYAEEYAAANGLTYVTYGEAAQDDPDDEKSATGAAIGTTVTVGSASYKVTASNAVTYVKSKKKNALKVTIPATVKINGKTYKVTAVSASAFAKNTKLKTVVIGKNVKSIGKKAFYNCKNLKKITFKGKNVKTIGTKAFKGTAAKATVKCPKTKKSAYKKLLKKAGLSAKAAVKS